MVHPLGILGVLLAKKYLIWTIFKSYGFARMYRRMMEFNRTINGGDKTRYNMIRVPVQMMFRAPSQAIKIVEENVGVLKFLEDFEKQQMQNPSFGTSIFHTLLRQTPFYKNMKEIQSVSDKVTKKP